MANLEYVISGNNTGLAKAINDSIALVQNLQVQVTQLGKGAAFTGLGQAISQANSQGLQLNKTLSDTSISAKDKGGIAALDALDRKLLTIRGNTDLFGESIKNQQSELGAYQSALNRLLSLGFEPLDGDVTRLKGNIDSLTASIQAQNSLSVKRPVISDSISEVANFNNSQNLGGSNVASSGTEALIRDLNKDLEAGVITAEEYKAAIDQINASQARFAQQSSVVNAELVEEEGLLAGLNSELKLLQNAKINIANPADLAKQNALIQELEAEIARLNNIGKVGFDSSGVAIKNFSKETEQAGGSVAGLGSGLTKGYGYLRQIAYILPGIGIAGIFNLAFEGITKAAEALDLFNSKLTVSQSNLANLNEVSKNASKQYGEQSTNLRILYTATQDVSNSEHNRVLAAQELQKEFPSLFGNIKTETILNGDAAGAYRDATSAILENAKAKAAATKISELAAKQLEAEFQEQKIRNAHQNEIAQLGNQSGLLATFRTDGGVNVGTQLKNESDQRAKASLAVQEQNKKDLQSQIDFLIQFAGGNDKIAAALSAHDKIKPVKDTENTFETLKNQLDEILAKSNHLSDQSGLTGYALEVQKVKDKYDDLNRSIDTVIKKAGVDLKGGKITQDQFGTISGTASKDKAQLNTDEDKELADLKIKEAQRVSDEVTRINNEFGVKASQTREKELQNIQKLYDDEVVKAKGNQDILTALDSGRAAAIEAVNNKYLLIEQDLQDKILAINLQAQADLQGIDESQTSRIIKEWEKRRQEANKYYNELKVLAASETGQIDALTGLPIGAFVRNTLNQQQSDTGANITKAESVDVNRKLLEPFTQGISQATKGVVNFFQTFNQQTDQSFSALFSGVTKTIEGVFNTIFENILDKQLSNALVNGITATAESAQKTLSGSLNKGVTDGTKNLSTQLSSGLTVALAAAGLLGSTISGLTPKTSIVGQGLGGALQGAASGAIIGSVIPGIGTVAGGVIGGAIGLLGGILGASKAQKEAQAQQLEQQKEQTALLKASLAYTSQIIGRATENGIVTNVSVGATGQLVATVSGKDLKFILDRTANGR